MNALVRLQRVGPLTTIQDAGRFGQLMHGISASGPVDRGAFALAGRLAGSSADGGIEFTRAGLDLTVLEGAIQLGWAGGAFTVSVNGAPMIWPGNATLAAGDLLSITPGPSGNYGYLRFGGQQVLHPTMGSLATSTRAKMGGLDGRALRAGDELVIAGEGLMPTSGGDLAETGGPIRFIWGIHAEHFSPYLRQKFVNATFRVSSALDRMGVRLQDVDNVFAGSSILSLVSDPILPGDIQILGDGTPIVLMRDHQPTGGYPRIGTVISADLDRFAQMRPGSALVFAPVTVEHAQRLMRGQSR